MTATAMNVTVTNNPRTELMDRETLHAMVKRLESTGADSSFFVGVLSKMDAFEQSLGTKAATPAQTGATPGAPKPGL